VLTVTIFNGLPQGVQNSGALVRVTAKEGNNINFLNKINLKLYILYINSYNSYFMTNFKRIPLDFYEFLRNS
jgi:hypothetical protein